MYTGRFVFAQVMDFLPMYEFHKCVNRYSGDYKARFSCLDSTTIDLCLSFFPWAHFRQHKGAVKMHTLMDLKCSSPTFIKITDGKVHDVNTADCRRKKQNGEGFLLANIAAAHRF